MSVNFRRFPVHRPRSTKKADVNERTEAFNHVGLLFNEPPRQNRVALQLVIRRLEIPLYIPERRRQQPSTGNQGRALGPIGDHRIAPAIANVQQKGSVLRCPGVSAKLPRPGDRDRRSGGPSSLLPNRATQSDGRGCRWCASGRAGSHFPLKLLRHVRADVNLIQSADHAQHDEVVNRAHVTQRRDVYAGLDELAGISFTFVAEHGTLADEHDRRRQASQLVDGNRREGTERGSAPYHRESFSNHELLFAASGRCPNGIVAVAAVFLQDSAGVLTAVFRMDCDHDPPGLKLAVVVFGMFFGNTPTDQRTAETCNGRSASGIREDRR